MEAGGRSVDLYPYLLRDTWVFDDPRTGLKEEAFVAGSTEMISRLVAAKQIPNPEKGFLLRFAAAAFDGYDVRLAWQSGNAKAGNWYVGEVAGQAMEGWLCPALYCYFTEAPPEIYVGAEPLPRGVDPIWRPAAGASARRFVEAPHATESQPPMNPRSTTTGPAAEGHEPKTLVRFDFPPGAGPKEIAAAIREAWSAVFAEKKARDEAAARRDQRAPGT